jgi:cysteate synthase
MKKYQLICVENGEPTHGEAFDFSCSKHNGLVRSVYSKQRLTLRNKPGIWRFIDWLPVNNHSGYSEKPITYKSVGLAGELGLENLFISFNGYWPERGVRMETCTFKELEGAVSVQYAKEHGVDNLVVASAGNTAKAYASTAMKERISVMLLVPEKCLCGVYLPAFDNRFAKTVILKDGDYSDSILLAKRIARVKGFTFEGGARNVARRDGLSTVLLDAAVEIGMLPDHYFQAVGSGTGAIAAYEAALRLIGDKRFGNSLPKFHLSQNLPVAPMYSAWRAGKREINLELDVPKADNVLDLVYARVLSNRYPPYNVPGGVYDVLRATNGDMYGVENRDGKRARFLFAGVEGIDILPAAAINVGALCEAVEKGVIDRSDTVLLNITGGGNRRLRKDKKLQRIKVDLRVSKDISDSEIRGLEL